MTLRERTRDGNRRGGTRISVKPLLRPNPLWRGPDDQPDKTSQQNQFGRFASNLHLSPEKRTNFLSTWRYAVPRGRISPLQRIVLTSRTGSYFPLVSVASLQVQSSPTGTGVSNENGSPSTDPLCIAGQFSIVYTSDSSLLKYTETWVVSFRPAGNP